MLTKQSLRRSLIQSRKAISIEMRTKKAQQLFNLVTRRSEFIQSQTLAAYFPYAGEMDVLPLLNHACLLGKRCYLPVLPAETPAEKATLQFMPYTVATMLIQNRYGIAEPQGVPNEQIAPEQLDLVILPLVGFDTQGNRLGTGAGYYDRTFAFIKERKENTHSKQPFLLGVGYELQKVESLPFDPWDIPLQGIATEDRYYEIKNE